MKKNKILFLLIFVLVAVGLVVLMNFLSKDDYEEPELPKPPKREIVTKFEDRCNDLGAEKWDSAKYIKLKDELAVFNDQKALTAAEGSSLSSLLEVKYAESLKNSCRKWQNSDGQESVDLLYRAVVRQWQIPDCMGILQNEKLVIEAYRSALLIPQRVSGFISGQFEQSEKNQLSADINLYCNREEIRHFSSLVRIKNEEANRLNRFEAYHRKYNATDGYYKNDPVSWKNQMYYNFCPESSYEAASETRLYPYYFNELKRNNICLP